MNRPGQITIKTHGLGIAAALILVACGGGDNTSGQGNSLAVSTPISPISVLTFEPQQRGSTVAADAGPVASISATPISGQTSLQVNFSAADVSRNSAAIVRYDWDFGDGNSAAGVSVSHSYDIPNTYTATLILTDANGQTDSTSRQINVIGNTVDNTQAIVPNGVYFFDDFNYSVRRSGDAISSFQDHGWSEARAENLTASGKGYLYTTDRIPGYSGPFPGKDSTQVLAIEGRPSTFNMQADFYLQFGGDFDNQVPADVWFQYWMYTSYYDDPADQEDQMSRFGRNPRLIYPTKDGYPSNNGLWVLYASNNSREPYLDELGQDATDFYMYLADPEDIRYMRADGGTNWKIGQTDLDERLLPNRWTLIKIHIDTSTVNPKYEQWLKPLGGQWRKVAEWIQGQTPNLDWQIALSDIGGHRSFRMPTTANVCSDSSKMCDFWMYLDDFTIATSEDTLPVYPY